MALAGCGEGVCSLPCMYFLLLGWEYLCWSALSATVSINLGDSFAFVWRIIIKKSLATVIRLQAICIAIKEERIWDCRLLISHKCQRYKWIMGALLHRDFSAAKLRRIFKVNCQIELIQKAGIQIIKSHMISWVHKQSPHGHSTNKLNELARWAGYMTNSCIQEGYAESLSPWQAHASECSWQGIASGVYWNMMVTKAQDKTSTGYD